MGEKEEVLYMEELNRVETKFDKQIAKLNEKLHQTDLKLERNNTITEQSTKAIEKMTDTMDSVKEAMIDISTKLSITERTNQELKENVENLNGKFERLETKVDDKVDLIEEKGKFDYLLWIKQNFVSLVIAGSLIGYMLLK